MNGKLISVLAAVLVVLGSVLLVLSVAGWLGGCSFSSTMPEKCVENKDCDDQNNGTKDWCEKEKGAKAGECKNKSGAALADADVGHSDSDTVSDVGYNVPPPNPCEELECDDFNPCTADWCDLKEGCKHQEKECPQPEVVEASPEPDDSDVAVADAPQDGEVEAGGIGPPENTTPDTVELVGETADSDAVEAMETAEGESPDLPTEEEEVAEPADNAGDADSDAAGGEVGPETEVVEEVVIVPDPCEGKSCDDGNVCTDGFCEPATGDCLYTLAVACLPKPDVQVSVDTATDTVVPGDTLVSPPDSVSPLDIQPPPIDVGAPQVDTVQQPDIPVVGVDIVVIQPDIAPSSDGQAEAVDSAPVDPCEGVVCEDFNPCTDNACVDGLCVVSNNAEPCDDGNSCTTGDQCQGGNCAPTGPVSCDDLNPCTSDDCVKAVGCVFVKNQNPCDDGNKCTLGDQCEGGQCQAGVGKLDCNDLNSCTADSCDSIVGCLNKATSDSCDDGDECTIGDQCADGACVSGQQKICNDLNPCTDDACVAGSCVSTSNTAPCDDGNACTTGDQCQGGECKPVGPVSCDDGNVCTNDACDPATGCKHTNNTAPCEDDNPCTIDTCVSGECAHKSVSCDDKNPCTDDACVPAKGCIFTPANDGLGCDDLNYCNDPGDKCQAGVCKGVSGVSCANDGNPCTEWLVTPWWGCGNCVYSASDGTACNDNNSCTASDKCQEAKCSGDQVPCDDGNPCTDDACDPAVGCKHTNNSTPCEDGNPCTKGDACAGGNCVPGPFSPQC